MKDLLQLPTWHTWLHSTLLQWSRKTSCHLVDCNKNREIRFLYSDKMSSAWTATKKRKAAAVLQNFSRDSVLLPAVEGFGVEHDVSAVAWLGAGDVALPAQLHPRHSQNRPGWRGSGQTGSWYCFNATTRTRTPTCHIRWGRWGCNVRHAPNMKRSLKTRGYLLQL